MDENFQIVSTRGSMWHRWDPHIHAPGTALNDLYTGEDPWGDFLTKVENSDPPIRVLGITDYCGIDSYVETIGHRNSGRLSNVGLIFPNVEFRLSIETKKGSAINIHLLFSPEAVDHVERIRHFLDGLSFPYLGEVFRCNRADLTRLGRVHNAQIINEVAAYSEGVKQFKISLDSLRDAWKKSQWAQDNCLIAVAGSSGDGTAGLQGDGGQWEATRKNIESLRTSSSQLIQRQLISILERVLPHSKTLKPNGVVASPACMVRMHMKLIVSDYPTIRGVVG